MICNVWFKLLIHFHSYLIFKWQTFPHSRLAYWRLAMALLQRQLLKLATTVVVVRPRNRKSRYACIAQPLDGRLSKKLKVFGCISLLTVFTSRVSGCSPRCGSRVCSATPKALVYAEDLVLPWYLTTTLLFGNEKKKWNRHNTKRFPHNRNWRNGMNRATV